MGDEDYVLNELKGLDILNMPPLQVFDRISEWKERLGK
jgi:hypothetical protein